LLLARSPSPVPATGDSALKSCPDPQNPLAKKGFVRCASTS
jgi:hypothetical protein